MRARKKDHNGAASPHVDELAGDAAPSAPTALRWLVPCVAVGIALLIALPAVMAYDRTFTANAIVQNRPDLDPAHLDLAVNIVIVDAAVWHGIDVLLSIWFVVKVLRGRRWARWALTAYLVIATAGSLYSAASGTQFLWAVIPGDVVHVVMLGLLWIPGSVRHFFAAHRPRVVRGGEPG